MKPVLPLTIQYRSISTLHPDPRNARLHTAKQISQIAKSIEAFGFNVPLLVDETGKVLAGHGRLLACMKLGWETVPTVGLNHLSPDQARAFAIADNRLNDISEWDDALLAENLRDLTAANLDFSIEDIGFTMGEIDVRIVELALTLPGELDPADQIAAVDQGPALTQPGDLWQIGQHRLLCGNALDADAYKALLGDEQAQLVFTDPPYNVPIQGHVSGNGVNQHREFAMAVGEMTKDEFIAFLTQVFGHLVRYTTAGSIHYICMDWRHSYDIQVAGRACYTELKNICVWVKDNGGMGSLYRSQHELVLVFKNGTASHRNNVQLGAYGRYRTNVWTYPGAHTMSRGEEGNLLALHPTVKPVQMVADAILDCSARGDLVLDPFLGSGTTLIAAHRVGRHCRAMELDPLYVDTAIRRWQQHTGDDAIHVASGLTFNTLQRLQRESQAVTPPIPALCVPPVLSASVAEGNHD